MPPPISGPALNRPSFDHPASGRRWLIGGRIQGVGFRPFVCLLADGLGIRGSVRNRGGCVEIIAASDAAVADLFLSRLLAEHPAVAQPEVLCTEACAPPTETGFRILPSTLAADAESGAAVLLPDQSVCPSCLADMAARRGRRHQYPFTTCAQCGPRYTITRAIPFDRASTAMAEFSVCSQCRAEYERHSDRRFHAQTIACADCGPRLAWRSDARLVEGDDAALDRAVAALRDGAIVAVKGIGGYHLLCDARNDAVVRALRARKERVTKPLAVPFPRAGADELGRVRWQCAPSRVEAAALRSAARPIVLVPLRPGSELSPAIAPGLREVGALLPYSPLHDLIAGRFGGPLVATSGNLGGEPVFTDPAEAEARLAGIADAFPAP
jgi:hydrogenase maturation protein HypF